jgi:uncharacterized protein (TIGR04255 family)
MPRRRSRLQNAPIVQAWVGFLIQNAPESFKWDREIPAKFFEAFETEFPEGEAEWLQQVAMQPVGADRIPEPRVKSVGLNKVRKWNAERTRFIQLTRDHLVLNVVEAGDAYPGFDTLSNEALAKLDHYVQLFAPSSLRELSLYYGNVLKVPVEGRTSIELSEVFRHFAFDLPLEPFGHTQTFEHNVGLVHANKRDRLSVSLRSMPWSPKDSEDGCTRFEMNLRFSGVDIESLERKSVADRLKEGHDYLWNCFKETFTDDFWDKFGYYEET